MSSTLGNWDWIELFEVGGVGILLLKPLVSQSLSFQTT